MPKFKDALPGKMIVAGQSVAGVVLRPKVGGYLGVRRWPGEYVRCGETVAEVRSSETFEVVDRLVSPLGGAVSCVGDPGGSGFVKAGVVAAAVKPVQEADGQ